MALGWKQCYHWDSGTALLSLDLKPNFKVALNLSKDCIALTFLMAGSKNPSTRWLGVPVAGSREMCSNPLSECAAGGSGAEGTVTWKHLLGESEPELTTEIPTPTLGVGRGHPSMKNSKWKCSDCLNRILYFERCYLISFTTDIALVTWFAGI